MRGALSACPNCGAELEYHSTWKTAIATGASAALAFAVANKAMSLADAAGLPQVVVVLVWLVAMSTVYRLMFAVLARFTVKRQNSILRPDAPDGRGTS
ncbi:MAG: hypothetical protein KIT09_02035 [Bryobacteraceae bacterium]|nr:hypothetical protein [Bryobacteraceae bacterium]